MIVGSSLKGTASHSSGKRLAPEERKRQILEQALAQISDSGGFGFTMREIALNLGVTHSLVFRYFDSKESLIEAVYQHVFAERFSPELKALVAQTNLAPIDKWVAFYEAYVPGIFDRTWTRVFLSSAMQGEIISRRYLATVVEPIIEHLAADTLDAVRESIGAPPSREAQSLIEELSWSLHSSFFYTGIRRWVYNGRTPDASAFIAARVTAHFASAAAAIEALKADRAP